MESADSGVPAAGNSLVAVTASDAPRSQPGPSGSSGPSGISGQPGPSGNSGTSGISGADAVLKLSAPTLVTALIGSDVLMSCTFSVDNPPVDPKALSILWYFEKTLVLSFVDELANSDPGLSLNKQAAIGGNVSLTVANVNISNSGIYECFVIYHSERKEKMIMLDIEARPFIKISNKLITKNEDSKLQCIAFGFYPPDIDIKWLRDGEVLKNSALGEVQQNPDGTCWVESSVTIPPIDNHRNETFSCQVQHLTLKMPIQEDFKLDYRVDEEQSSTPGKTAAIIVSLLLIVAVTVAALWFLIFKRKCLHRFVVSEIIGPMAWKDGDMITLKCTASKCVKEAQVTWIVTESDGRRVTISGEQFTDEENDTLLFSHYTVGRDRSVTHGLHKIITTLRFTYSLPKHKNMMAVCKFDCDGKSIKKFF